MFGFFISGYNEGGFVSLYLVTVMMVHTSCLLCLQEIVPCSHARGIVTFRIVFELCVMPTDTTN